MTTPARKRKLWLAALAVALVVAAVLGFGVLQRRTVPVSPTQVVPPEWQTARTSPMHVAHVEEAKIECAKCHAAGFVDKPSEATCNACHAKAVLHAHRGAEKAPTTCLTCHAFGAGKVAATCVGCHAGGPAAAAGDAAKAAHALAKHVSKEAACGACHTSHGDKAAKLRVALADCTACHTSVAVAHGRASAAASGEEDAGEPFDAAVARFAADTKAEAALRDGGTTATAKVCSACHAPHTAGAAAAGACATCHVGGGERAHGSDAQAKSGDLLLASFAPRIEPRGRHVAGHAACTTCHEPHRVEKADAKRCEDCHADHRAAITPVAGHTGHQACMDCHTPHAPAEAKASCASAGCHAGKTVMAAPRVAAHAECRNCHEPHQPGKSPALACVKCHEDVQAKHPGVVTKNAGASACIGCHAPHDAKANAMAVAAPNAHGGAAACSSCHTKAHGEKGFHAGGVVCTACHAPHDFGSRLLRNAAGAPAHGMPAAKAESASLCAKCHAAKTNAVAARPGHAECGACHGAPHSPVKKPACASCHAKETASTLPGHATCTNCHDSHSGSLGKHVECTSCHAEKSKQHHGALPNGGCASCHTPHGPKGVAKPPACTTCHAPAKLVGLHSVGAHVANCASCHGSHSEPRADRATCTSSCHLDRRNHQPAAQVCKGCHMFRQ